MWKWVRGEVLRTVEVMKMGSITSEHVLKEA